MVQKWPSFQNYFLGTIGQENVFYDILKRKNTFLGYKNKKFKKSKNWHFSKGDNSWFWSKNGHFSNDTIRIEYREERLVFFLQSHQTIFVGQICLKRKNKPIWNFWPKPWTKTPFEKYKFCVFFISMFLRSKKSSFLYRTSPNTFFRHYRPGKRLSRYSKTKKHLSRL